MDHLHALELDLEEWAVLLRDEMAEPDYRAGQICDWIYKKRVFTFDGMTNLSKELRGKLESLVRFTMPELEGTEISPADGTLKYLWRLEDGEKVESVLLRHPQHTTACLSSQVGCPLACSFCVTGQGGFIRHLSAGEILAQFLAMEAHQKGPIQNVVYMGMGEPLLNHGQVFRSVRMLRNPRMRGLGQRHITISTGGIVPGIDALAAESLGVGLSVSLHAANDALRSRLMPLNRTYPLASLRRALTHYQRAVGDRITLEYMLLRDVNDAPVQAEELAAWIGNLKVYVNLIPYNPGAGNFERPSRERAERFRDLLRALGVNAELRRERGGDVRGACGQLRSRDGSPVLNGRPRGNFGGRDSIEVPHMSRTGRGDTLSGQRRARGRSEAERFGGERDTRDREDSTIPRRETRKGEGGVERLSSRNRSAGGAKDALHSVPPAEGRNGTRVRKTFGSGERSAGDERRERNRPVRKSSPSRSPRIDAEDSASERRGERSAVSRSDRRDAVERSAKADERHSTHGRKDFRGARKEAPHGAETPEKRSAPGNGDRRRRKRNA